METIKQTTKLNSIKDEIKELEHFIKSKPFPSESSLDEYIKANGIEYLTKYATSLLSAVAEREWLMFQYKVHKYRV